MEAASEVAVAEAEAVGTAEVALETAEVALEEPGSGAAGVEEIPPPSYILEVKSCI